MFPILFLMSELLQPAKGLSITVENVQKASGSIYLSIYDRADRFMDVEKIAGKQIVPVKSKGSMSIVLADLPPGEYAVSCFHDVNDNGKLDTNFLGIPTEPYAFSNNARPKFRAPNWDEARFSYPGGDFGLSIRLEKW
jgi:uncharacterized protein (DUF2141 family)